MMGARGPRWLIFAAASTAVAAAAMAATPEELARSTVALTTYTLDAGDGTHGAKHGAATILHESGYALAAAHATGVGILHVAHLADGTRLAFRVVAQVTDHDIAIVKIEADDSLPAAPIGTAAHLELEAPVIAIGNSGGRGHTIHQGTISHLRVEGGRFALTGMDVNPGDSGGSVYDTEGRLIGMVQLKLLEGEHAGAALRIDHLRAGLAQLLAEGATGEWQRLGLQVDTGATARILRVRSGAAVQAGLRPGDVVRRLGALTVADGVHYVIAVLALDSTGPHRLEVEREGETIVCAVMSTGPQLRPAAKSAETRPGLMWTRYRGRWTALPDFTELEHAGTGVTASLAIPGDFADNDTFGLVFRGRVHIPHDGRWVFHLTSDEGSRLFLGDEPLVANDFLHHALAQSAAAHLAAGWHPVEVHYFDLLGPQELSLSLAGPGHAKSPVAPSQLCHEP